VIVGLRTRRGVLELVARRDLPGRGTLARMSKKTPKKAAAEKITACPLCTAANPVGYTFCFHCKHPPELAKKAKAAGLPYWREGGKKAAAPKKPRRAKKAA
jgi:hypothetical protein